MINYSETYAIMTEESASLGDYAETGFIEEDAKCDFRDMVGLLVWAEPSCYPMPTNPSKYMWYTEYLEQDHRTGNYETRSYHPKTERDAKWMVRAWRLSRGEE